MIYILAIRQLVPGKMAEYREAETKGLIPVLKKSGAKMVGHWNTLIGNSYETVNLLAFDDMAHFLKFRGDPDYQKVGAAIGAITVSANLRLLEPSEWSPMK